MHFVLSITEVQNLLPSKNCLIMWCIPIIFCVQIDFIIAGDTNRLNLSPILNLNLSPALQQVVKVPTRLNPDRILDPIITTLSKYYCEPVTKPPINPNTEKTGKPSDHLQPRVYKTLTNRPINFPGLQKFAQWVETCSWTDIYKCEDPNMKAEIFQNLLLNKYYECFPEKVMKICCEDKPWFTADLKSLDRKRKREFSKHYKSELWVKLNNQFIEKCSKAKEKYYKNMVSDLKESNPGKWHSKLKRMSGQENGRQDKIQLEEISVYSDQTQADMIAEHYADISNQYEQIKKDDFPEYNNKQFCPPKIEPWKVNKTIQSMNKKAATIPGDVPMKIIAEFSVELATPLAHIFNCCLESSTYPNLYKSESVTPAPKKYPPEKMQDLRKISGFLNCAKLFDKLIAEYLIQDMTPSKDPSQYGNEKNISIQHYLIKMINKVLTTVDESSRSESYAVLISMVDWSQAFDRQCHTLGVKSFIENGVRESLIPLMISYFENRRMKVKWNGCISTEQNMNGGGAQGGLPGILEYLSQNNDCANFLDEDERYKYIDDLSILEILNLISLGISSYNCKVHVPSDIQSSNNFIHPANIKSQEYINKIEEWTRVKKMKLNTSKSKYMIVNFSKKYQANTRLHMGDQILEQVQQTRLLGVILDDRLSWQANTNFIIQKAYKRMSLLHRLYEFAVPVQELIEIYILYIRSVLESSAVVWNSSLTRGQDLEFERVKKVA